MKFDLNNLNPGTWFDVDEGEGRVCLRICDIETIKRIRKQTVKKRKEYRLNQRYAYDEVNEDLDFELTWDYIIIDWKELYDINDKEIPCTKENKILLMSQSVKFASFIAECTDELSRIEEKEEKESLGN